MDFYEHVYKLVRRIPRGRVMTYGQIATILGAPRAARAVGYAMRACKPGNGVPWQRVINRHGGISTGGDPDRPTAQRILLEEEGVEFDDDDCCDLSQRRWEPRDPGAYLIEGGSDLPFR